MTPSTRKMRRSRDVAPSGGDVALLSGFGLYELQGDSKAALDAFSAGVSSSASEGMGDLAGSGASSQLLETGLPSLAMRYNTMLLGQVVAKIPASRKAEFLHELRTMEEAFVSKNQLDPTLSARKRKRNNMILSYNRALALHAAGDCAQSAMVCADKLRDMMDGRTKPSDEISVVTSRMSFLLLECILALSVGRKHGLRYQQFKVPHPDIVFAWLDRLDSEKDPQHKFLLTLYKSRFALAEYDVSGKHVESKVRAARKELKLAMEVFQHKLRPSFGGDSGSVVSSAASEENVSTNAGTNPLTGHSHAATQESTSPPASSSSAVLQKHNQSALGLKANLEQLKGNTKKSLILCSEAQGAVAKQDWSYQAIHENNLAVVYATNQKRHLALHALTKALQANTADTSLFSLDGTARPDPAWQILHNTALCALQAGQYRSAYECMAACCRCYHLPIVDNVQTSAYVSPPARCWLRLAEACIGIFAALKNAHANTDKKFSAIDIHGEPRGIILDSSFLSDDLDVSHEKLVPILGSQEDLEQVQRNPLLRARAALETALQYQDELSKTQGDLVAAYLSLSYVCLAFRDFSHALDYAMKVIEQDESGSPTGGSVASCLQHRQIATARMYAAEASCALGKMVDAMKFLVGDGKDDAFDRLAVDLSGVTLEAAASNGKGKRRLAKAQTMVRSSACAVTAAMGNVQAAKQLANSAIANSANAMEDAYASNLVRTSARRALIYTLLREGQQAPALNLLISLRQQR